MKATKKIAATIGVAAVLSLTAYDAGAVSCAQGDVAGKWNVTFENSFKSRSRPEYPVQIDAAGNMDGTVQINDGLGLIWGFKSITPVKVNAKCVVTGEFGIFYGGPQAIHRYAWRTNMSLDKLEITGAAIVWPGYDNAEIEKREMWISLKKAP